MSKIEEPNSRDSGLNPKERESTPAATEGAEGAKKANAGANAQPPDTTNGDG